MNWTRPLEHAAVVVLLAGVPLAGFACGGGGKDSAVGDAKLPSGASSKSVDHEDCSEAGNKVEVLDSNGDGKPDIRRIYDKSGHEKCRIVDLNHDGKPDMYEYYDASGTVRRREYCYDDTGVVNAIEYFDAGKLARREYDTTGLHKIDTWDWFDGSAPVDAKTGRPSHPSRRERDVTGDGHVDQWWTWSADTVSIASDANGDGKPDPASTVMLDKNGAPLAPDNGAGAAPPSAASSAAPSASGASAASSSASSAAPTSSAATPTASTAAAPAPSAAADGGKP